MKDFLKSEPVISGMLTRAGLAIAGRYGFELAADEVIALMLLAEVLVGPLVRKFVTPVNKT